jgi:hypothetical protein
VGIGFVSEGAGGSRRSDQGIIAAACRQATGSAPTNPGGTAPRTRAYRCARPAINRPRSADVATAQANVAAARARLRGGASRKQRSRLRIDLERPVAVRRRRRAKDARRRRGGVAWRPVRSCAKRCAARRRSVFRESMRWARRLAAWSAAGRAQRANLVHGRAQPGRLRHHARSGAGRHRRLAPIFTAADSPRSGCRQHRRARSRRLRAGHPTIAVRSIARKVSGASSHALASKPIQTEEVIADAALPRWQSATERDRESKSP